MVRIEHVLESWKVIREDTAAAVEDFPGGELEFRATPEMQSFGEIAAHVLQASDGLAGLLLSGEVDLTTPGVRQKMMPFVGFPVAPAAAPQMAAALRSALERRLAELAAQTPEFYAGTVTRFDGTKVTRLEMVQTLKEH